MKDLKGIIKEEWQRFMARTFTGRRFVIDYDEQIPRIIMPLDRVVADISNAKCDLFQIKQGKNGGRLVCTNKLGKRVMDCVDNLDVGVVREYLTRHRFSPYFELWEQALPDLSAALDCARRLHDVQPLNRCIAEIRKHARKSTFRSKVQNQERAARKNWASMRVFIDAMFSECARLLVARVDLGYRNDPMDVGWNWVPPTDKQVKSDLVKLLRYIRRNVPELAGYVWKLEYGASKGLHVHAVLLCRGHRVQSGYAISKLVKDKWIEITNGAGSGWNCNANEALFKRRGNIGIGMIDYWNLKLRQSLYDVGMYVAKSDYYARFVSPEIGRTFGKSMVKRKASNRGRPRMYEDAANQSEDQAA